jgi:hypothetical protein
MLRLRPQWLWPAAWLVVTTAAQAGHQAPAAPDTPPNPLDARAAVPRAVHESAFRLYRGHADVTLTPWKEANDNVGRIGGWRSYAREAAQAEASDAAPAASAPAGASAPAPAGRGGHANH